jgi:hypothetical protein
MFKNTLTTELDSGDFSGLAYQLVFMSSDPKRVNDGYLGF